MYIKYKNFIQLFIQLFIQFEIWVKYCSVFQLWQVIYWRYKFGSIETFREFLRKYDWPLAAISVLYLLKVLFKWDMKFEFFSFYDAKWLVTCCQVNFKTCSPWSRYFILPIPLCQLGAILHLLFITLDSVKVQFKVSWLYSIRVYKRFVFLVKIQFENWNFFHHKFL